jgi:hypothetical protein
MKKIVIVLSLISLIFTSCEIETSQVVIEDIDLDLTSFTEKEYHYVNNDLVLFETTYNIYTVNVFVTNNGLMTAYDVEVDVYISATNGESFTETHFIESIKPNETIYIDQDEVFENARIDEYSADVYWSE